MSKRQTQLKRMVGVINEKQHERGDWLTASQCIRDVLRYSAKDKPDLVTAPSELTLEVELPTGARGKLAFVELPLGEIRVVGSLPNPDGLAEPYEKTFCRVPPSRFTDANEVSDCVAAFFEWVADELEGARRRKAL